MRSPRANPFQPGWGKPMVWAGRGRAVSEFLDVLLPRVKDGVKEVPRLIQDERGMGKTALLQVLAEEAEDRGCIVLSLTATRGEDFTRAFATTAATASRPLSERLTASILDGLGRVAGLSVAGSGVALTEGRTQAPVASIALTDALVDLARLARADGTAVVLLLDEVQNIGLEHVAVVFTALQRAIEHTEVKRHPSGGRLRLALPIVTYCCGLPATLARFKKARVTFGERCELRSLGPLSDEDLQHVLITFESFNSEGVRVDVDALDPLLAYCAGYPYAFQLLGKAAWDAGEGPFITRHDVELGIAAVEPSMRERYAARLEGLTDEQVGYLRAAASLPPTERSPSAVCRAHRREPAAPASACGGLQARLVEDHQVIRRGPGGRVEFALPGLDRYLAG